VLRWLHTHSTDSSVNTESTSRSHMLHDGQKGGTDHDVGGPDTSSQDSRSHSSQFEREKLGTLLYTMRFLGISDTIDETCHQTTRPTHVMLPEPVA
jgi:hypothetical protein